MFRIVVCSVALLAIIMIVRVALHSALAEWGYWPYMAVCITGFGAFCIIAYLYDRANTRSQEVLPPERRDYQ